MINSYAGLTDKGLVRKKNEDNWTALPEQGLFIVADGIGGLPAGELASKMVTDILPELLHQRIGNVNELAQLQVIQHIKLALIDLSQRIATESAKRDNYAGMGTTVVMLMVTKDYLYIAYLGDSRAYLMQSGNLQQLTRDHSLAQYLIDNNLLEQENLSTHTGKNHLLQYVGMSVKPEPDVICLEKYKAERILLCSDGLSNMIEETQLQKFLNLSSTPEQTCKALIKAANLAGGKDNITALLVDIDQN